VSEGIAELQQRGNQKQVKEVNGLQKWTLQRKEEEKRRLFHNISSLWRMIKMET